jgi:hypothetical protein
VANRSGRVRSPQSVVLQFKRMQRRRTADNGLLNRSLTYPGNRFGALDDTAGLGLGLEYETHPPASASIAAATRPL